MARTRRSSAKPPGSPRSKRQNSSPIPKNLPKKKNRVHSPSKKKQRQQRRCNMQAPSPNLQTRSKRKESGVSYAMNTVESTRIAKIIADFKGEENKPCSCFGADREERYRDYFFCHQCLLADRQEQNKPNLFTNRKSERGLFKCQAEHKSFIHPTHRLEIIVPKENLRQTSKEIKEKIAAKVKKREEARDSRIQPSSQQQVTNRMILIDPEGNKTKPMSPKARKYHKKYLHKTSKAQTVGFSGCPSAASTNEGTQIPNSSEARTKPDTLSVKKLSSQVPKSPPKKPPPSISETTGMDSAVGSCASPSNASNKDRTLSPHRPDSPSVRTEVPPSVPKSPPKTPPFSVHKTTTTSNRSPANKETSTIPVVIETNKTSQPETSPAMPTNDSIQDATVESYDVPEKEQDDNAQEEGHTEAHEIGRHIVQQLKEAVEKLQEESNVLKERLRTADKKVERKKSQVKYWRKQCARKIPLKIPKSVGRKENAMTLADHVRNLVEDSVSRLSNDSLGSQTLFKELTTMLLDPSLHGGQSLRCAYDVFRSYVRKHVFTPFEILRQMDLRGGGLNYSNIEVLRNVETQGRPWQRTLLPSTSVLQDCARQVEEYGQNFCPYRMIRNKNDGSEGFAFRAADVMVAILMAGQVLEDEAVLRPIHLAQSMDGALFTNNLAHTLGGLKFNDQASDLRQSRDGVFPVLCVCSRESKGIVRGIFYRMIKEIEEAAHFVVPQHFGTEVIVITTNCDMSLEWKLVARGGAARQVTYPCAKCAVRSGQLHIQSQPTHSCVWCQELGHLSRPNWVCRHHRICTKNFIAEVRQQADSLEKHIPTKLGSLEETWMASNLTHSEDPRNDVTPIQKGTTKSIHFDLSRASREDRKTYSENLTHDLALRDMDFTGSLEVRQNRLLAQHIKEWTYFRACQSLSQFENSQIDSALVLVLDIVPCILHMENRMGLLFLSLVLKIGLANVKRKGMSWMSTAEKKTENQRIEAFRNKVNKTMNTKMLGSEDQPRQWVLPYDKESKSIAIICMDNVRIRKVVASFDNLLHVCLTNKNDIQRWKTCLSHYRQGYEILLRKENLDNSTIFEFQKQMDLFFADWVELHGENGVTNYAHMLGSGHIMEFLLHYKNLSAHSQQGWEGT